MCLVGENIRYTPGVASQVFQALNGINIRMISQGASLLNLGVVVAEKDLKCAVTALHQQFFHDPDPERHLPLKSADLTFGGIQTLLEAAVERFGGSDAPGLEELITLETEVRAWAESATPSATGAVA